MEKPSDQWGLGWEALAPGLATCILQPRAQALPAWISLVNRSQANLPEGQTDQPLCWSGLLTVSLVSTERSLIQLLALTSQACLSLTSAFVVSPEGQREAWPGPEFSGADGGAIPPFLGLPQILTVNSSLGWVYRGSCDIISTCGGSTSQFTWLSRSPTA